MERIEHPTIIDSVDLVVIDRDALVDFYVQHLGFNILKQNEQCIELGVDTPLVRLFLQEPVKDNEEFSVESTGLYHFAIKVPTRQDLGEILISLHQKGILGGASNHGYSEALYLADPLGNGIEIYCDRPIEEWDIREDGEIVGFTDQIEAQGLVDLAQKPFVSLPSGTVMGHVHLLVHDLQETEKFYTDLGLRLVSNFGTQAKFFAKGMYHHHIGTNTWYGKLPIRKENQLGVKAIRLKLDDHTPKTIVDPNGITLIIQ